MRSGQDVRGLRCLDIGSSTGGFSDCLLQAGAASVACVDVNYGQLAWKLRQDPRVSVFERVNIKLADPVELGAPFDVLVADLSFIGLAALAPVFARLSQPGTVFIGLVKPQFESRPDETERGVVRDERAAAYGGRGARGVGGCRVRRDGCRGVAHHRARGQCGVPGARRVRRVSR